MRKDVDAMVMTIVLVMMVVRVAKFLLAVALVLSKGVDSVK
jgi:hypothetical protein